MAYKTGNLVLQVSAVYFKNEFYRNKIPGNQPFSRLPGN